MDFMKIGYVTLFDYNYGSALQAFATKAFLEANGIDAFLIKSKQKSKMINRLKLLGFCLLHLRNASKIFEIIDSQRSKNQLLSADSESMIKQFIDLRLKPVCLSDLSKSELKLFDLFLTGSDQVWNGSHVLNDFFFLRFADKKRRVAWAPSFGSKEIASYNFSRYKRYIRSFRKLSVREESGRNIINSICPNTCVEVLSDPVILLTKKKWADSLGISDISTIKGQVFCLFLNEPSKRALSYVRELKEKYEYSFLSLGYKYESLTELGVAFLDGGPDSFLKHIFCSSLVLTDSFHATIFSLISHTPFYAFERQYAHSQNQSVRILDLLSECDLIDRYEPNHCDTWDSISFSAFDITCERKKETFRQYLLKIHE